MIAIWLLTAFLGFQASAAAAGPADSEALDRVRDWVTGYFDNAAQIRDDFADPDLPDELRHRQVHQLFVPVAVQVPAIPGHLVFQQSSSDGSWDQESIARVGLLQFLVEPGTGVVRQRELNFRDREAWRNAHLDPGRFTSLATDQLAYDAGCDFLLKLNSAGDALEGRIAEGACRIRSAGLGREIIADDAVRITDRGYEFLGRFVDETGRVVWGNASDVPYRMRRVAPSVASGDVLVFGGTRGTGLEVVRQLVARGERVSALVRPGSDREALEELGVHIVTGDALEATDVLRAMHSRRHRAIVSTLGCQGCESPPDYEGNRNLVDAAREAGIDRMVLVSTIGAGDSAAAPPWIARWILRDVIDLKTRAEEHLVASGLHYTIIRPGGLKDGPRSGRGELTEDREAMGIINRSDVAALIVRTLDDPRAIGRTYAALDPGLQWPWDLF